MSVALTTEQRQRLAGKHERAAKLSTKLLTDGRAGSSLEQQEWLAFHESLYLFHTQRARELRDGWL